MVTSCKQEKQLSEIIERIRIKYAPEKRESVYNIAYKKINSKTYQITGEVDSNIAKSNLLDTLLASGFLIIDSIEVLPSKTLKPWGLITISVANLKASPSHTSELVSQAIMGTPVKILKEKNNWAFIKTPDNYLAWCEKIALSFRDDEEMQNWKESERIILKNLISFIKDPKTGQNISDIVAGSIVVKEEENSADILIEVPDGRKGIITSADYVTFSSIKDQAQPDINDIKITALKFTGIPYLWGGTSIKAADCSGFVKTVYQLHGIILARDASLQVSYGTQIPVTNGWKEFETGDLVFFSSKPKVDKITHVGMYLGRSEIIHSSGLVRINSLDSTSNNYTKYYSRNIHSVRRIIGAEKNRGIVYLKDHEWY